MRRWEAERNYAYCCDMLKAIRQDLTVQHLADAHASRSAFSIEVYEAHARLALLNDDIGEFSACQAALVPLHAAAMAAGRRSAANHAEFCAYRLLHAAALRGRSLGSELGAVLGSLGSRCGASHHDNTRLGGGGVGGGFGDGVGAGVGYGVGDGGGGGDGGGARHYPAAVALALEVSTALHLDDPIRVLRRLPSLHHLGACLLRGKLPILRERALRVLCKAYSPTLSLSRLAPCLGFGEHEVACESWLRSIGAVPHHTSSRAAGSGGNGSMTMVLDTKAALRMLITREAEAAKEAQAEADRDRQRRPSIGPSIPLDLLESSW